MIIDKMVMVPTTEKFIHDIMLVVNKISKSIIRSSKILDFEGTLKDMEKYGFNLIEYILFTKCRLLFYLILTYYSLIFV